MRVIDRLYEYLKHHHIAPYTFERNCGIANGYLKKQTKGKGSIGSDILEKISTRYADLSLIWLITGNGIMLPGNTNYQHPPENGNWSEEETAYPGKENQIALLRDKVTILKNALSDKEKIISLLEAQIKQLKSNTGTENS